MATATYSASLITRKTSSSSNAKTGYACQEFYANTYNYVGVICFSGMSLTNKVITGISITAVSQQAGYGAGHTKTVYVRKSNYQNTSAGATGSGYCGDALGTRCRSSTTATPSRPRPYTRPIHPRPNTPSAPVRWRRARRVRT